MCSNVYIHKVRTSAVSSAPHTLSHAQRSSVTAFLLRVATEAGALPAAPERDQAEICGTGV